MAEKDDEMTRLSLDENGVYRPILSRSRGDLCHPDLRLDGRPPVHYITLNIVRVRWVSFDGDDLDSLRGVSFRVYDVGVLGAEHLGLGVPTNGAIFPQVLVSQVCELRLPADFEAALLSALDQSSASRLALGLSLPQCHANPLGT